MRTNHHIWVSWEQKLHRWGIDNLVSVILEALGPMTLLGAQGIYLVKPWLDIALPDEHIDALVELLENPQATRTFIHQLKEEKTT